MLRLLLSTSLITMAAFALLFASTLPSSAPPQPIQFSHKAHVEYFQDDGPEGHRESMVALHEEILGEFSGDTHGRSMVARHKEILLKELEDEDIVNGMMGDVEKGYCRQCHRDFDDNARDLAKLLACAQCHRRKDPENENFAAEMIVDVQEGRCKLCHGDFDKNAGENVSRLGHCAQCHAYFVEHDWEGREDRPCLGCHHAAAGYPRMSIPNTDTCAACHPLPLQGDREETSPEEAELVKYIEQENEQDRKIPWMPVYDYVPSEIVFSHEPHIAMGRVKCQECHGPVEEAEQPLSVWKELSMEDCMDCHEHPWGENGYEISVADGGHEDAGEDDGDEVRGADNDCLACHR